MWLEVNRTLTWPPGAQGPPLNISLPRMPWVRLAHSRLRRALGGTFFLPEFSFSSAWGGTT